MRIERIGERTMPTQRTDLGVDGVRPRDPVGQEPGRVHSTRATGGGGRLRRRFGLPRPALSAPGDLRRCSWPPRRQSAYGPGPLLLNPYTLHPVEIPASSPPTPSNGRAYLGLVQGAWLDTLGLAEGRSPTALREAVTVYHASVRRRPQWAPPPAFHACAGPGLPVRAATLRGAAHARYVGQTNGRVRGRGGRGGAEARRESANPDLVPVVREWDRSADVGIVLGPRGPGRRCCPRTGQCGKWNSTCPSSRVVIRRSRSPPVDEPPLDRFVFAGMPDEGHPGMRSGRSLRARPGSSSGPPRDDASARGVGAARRHFLLVGSLA